MNGNELADAAFLGGAGLYNWPLQNTRISVGPMAKLVSFLWDTPETTRAKAFTFGLLPSHPLIGPIRSRTYPCSTRQIVPKSVPVPRKWPYRNSTRAEDFPDTAVRSFEDKLN